jgi:hypothetical protein
MRALPVAALVGFLHLSLALVCLLGGCGLTPDKGPPVVVTGGGCQRYYDSFGARTTVGGCTR